MAYTKTNWVNDESPDIDADNLNKMEQGIADAQFPDGGVSGQLLSKTINGTEWVDAPNSAVWGLIQGTLSDQTDLAYALANTGKVDTVNGIQPDVYKNVQVDIELTKAEYDALPSSKESDDVNYYIKDGTDIPAASVISASGVQYDNTQSGMSATNVQSAVDELKSVLTMETATIPASSVNESINVTGSALRKFGRVAEIYFEGTTTAQISAWALLLSGVPSKYRPYATNNAYSVTVGANLKMANFNSQGILNIPEAIPTNTNVRFHAVYFTAS